MVIAVIRRCDAVRTRGTMLVDGVPFSDTIEPMKNSGKGCIPMGWYRVSVTNSPKFGRPMPLLHLVPGFEGIRIHAGMSEENTSGCICVGERWKENELTKLLTAAQKRHEEIYICITDTDHYRSELSNLEDPYKGCFGY